MLGDTFYKNKKKKQKNLSMDLESRVIQGVMEIYPVSIYDGITIIDFYLSDYKNSVEMLKSSVIFFNEKKISWI